MNARGFVWDDDTTDDLGARGMRHKGDRPRGGIM